MSPEFAESTETTGRFKIPASEIRQRTLKIQNELQQNGIDGLFVIQRVDMLYFSGTAQNGCLYMPAEGDPVLFIKQHFPRARQESSIENMIEIESIKEVPKRIAAITGRLPAALAYELDVLPVNDFKFYQSLLQPRHYVDGSPFILKLRMIKSDWEIRQMEQTAKLTRNTFEHMRTVIRPGLTEMEFAGIFEAYARKFGHAGKLRTRHYQTEAYPWHVLSGTSGGKIGLLEAVASGEGTSAAFPVGAGNRKLRANEPIMVDLGLVLNGYHLDETRMFAIEGMPDKAGQASRAAIEIHNTVLENAKPGVVASDLFDEAAGLAKSLGYEDAYLGSSGHKVSFIGHGIGLEMIEPYFIAKNRQTVLEPGMTFALEPKMIYENEFCAGIESVFAVTETGSRLITKVPVEVFIC
jgi:Xaa-Pro dipeptidase